jgi:hypothetical protein
MDTVARHPVTALLSVALFVALSLHFGIRPPPPPRSPPPAPAEPAESDTPAVTIDNIGKPMTLSGRVGQVGHGQVPFLVLALGKREAVCRFGEPGSDSSPIANVRTGDFIAVRGVVGGFDPGSITLAGCKLVPPSKP